MTAAGKIAKTYERATDLERIGDKILALPVPQNILIPPTVAAYDDLDSTIHLDDKDKTTSFHLTLNPFQVRVLAKYLSIALTQIDFANLLDEQHFGDPYCSNCAG